MGLAVVGVESATTSKCVCGWAANVSLGDSVFVARHGDKSATPKNQRFQRPERQDEKPSYPSLRVPRHETPPTSPILLPRVRLFCDYLDAKLQYPPGSSTCSKRGRPVTPSLLTCCRTGMYTINVPKFSTCPVGQSMGSRNKESRYA